MVVDKESPCGHPQKLPWPWPGGRLSDRKPGPWRSRWLLHFQLLHFHWKYHPSRGIIQSSCTKSRSVGHGVALLVAKSTEVMRLPETPTVQARGAPCLHALLVQFAERNVSMGISCGGWQIVFFSRGAPPSHVLNSKIFHYLIPGRNGTGG